MIIAKDNITKMLSSPIRKIRGRVELYNGSTLTLLCGCGDKLKSFSVERIGEEGKFFGYGVCQKLTCELLDKGRELSLDKSHTMEIEFGVDNDFIYPYPKFYIEDIKRDEKTNDISITAYDALYSANNIKVSELDLPAEYTLLEFAEACATLLGVPLKVDSRAATAFNIAVERNANFDGTETIREALNDIAEATQTIYFINSLWELSFIRLDMDSEPVMIIDKSKYIELESGELRELGAITATNELGNATTATLNEAGENQFIRNNAFYELREDMAELLEEAVVAVDGLALNEFNCNWRGNFLLEIGDKIALTTKDDNTITSYVVHDSIDYNGGLKGNTRWRYQENDTETANNPTTLGEALKLTYAKVDKVNKQIEIVVAEQAAIKLDADSIQASVSKMDDSISELSRELTAKMTDAEIEIAIQTSLAEGVDKVITSTGFKLDKDGLNISKSDSEISTTITENGMQVKNRNEEVLVANNEGVKAEDLHATTYLIVGTTSRFENYGTSRTGCFWIAN